MRVIVAITGGSGVIIAQRLLQNLGQHEVHLIVSDAAKRVMAHELTDPALPATFRYAEADIDACISSSSNPIDAMVIVPCSMKTLSAVATGYADNLVARAAENALRMGRKLILVPRETPLSLAAIENMRAVRLAGGIILPPNVAYYFQPRTVDDITDFFVGKILDVLGIDHSLYHCWAGGTALEMIEEEARHVR
jgi:4-hydroxy-3-polyprenylbenzoate decarboxylase